MADSTIDAVYEHLDDWREVHFRDGTQQWYIQPLTDHYISIERVVRPDSRRKRWAIVNRDAGVRTEALYPPKICGPFPNLESAKAAYLVIIHSR